MHKYRGNEAPPAQGKPTKPAHRKVPAYMSLADEYCLEDEDMRIGKWRGGKQTVDEEYQIYMAETPSVDNTDPLKFWEVGGDSDIDGFWTLLTRCGSSGGQSLQLCTRWPWTIFLYKHLPFLVNACSRWVQRPTPRRGIDSVPSQWKLFRCLNSIWRRNISIS